MWRAASVCLLLGVVWQLNRTGGVRTVASSVPVQLLAQAADEVSGNYGIPLFSARTEHDRTVDQMTATPASAIPIPAVMPGFFRRDRLLNIREEMDLRHQDILELYDQDRGDWDRDDAWQMVLPFNLAVA